MKKSKFLLLLLLLCFKGYSQSRNIYVASSKKGCLLTFIFKSVNIKEQIPDLSLRTVVEGNYLVLDNKFIEVRKDTLVLNFHSKKTSENNVVIPHNDNKNAQAIVRYPDIVLHGRCKQIVRLPQGVCARRFTALKMFYDGKLLAFLRI